MTIMRGKIKVYRLEIPGKPMGKQRPKFGKGFTYTPQKTVDYENYVKLIFQQKYGQPNLTGQIKADIKVYFDIPQSTSKVKKAEMLQNTVRPTKKPDCDNIAKIILDSLNGIAYADDKQIISLSVEKYYSDTPKVYLILQGGKENENV